jgi:hypothetical protein
MAYKRSPGPRPFLLVCMKRSLLIVENGNSKETPLMHSTQSTGKSMFLKDFGEELVGGLEFKDWINEQVEGVDCCGEWCEGFEELASSFECM